MNRQPIEGRHILLELGAAGIALLALVTAQLMLSAVIHGTNYYGVDGKMTQTAVLTSMQFADPFDVTTINPLQGMGSQLVPKNAWANPSFWPFAFFDRERATDYSAAIALGCFAAACYGMARCFELPITLSAILAQSMIVLFAPMLLLVHTPTNFCLTPGDAVVYAPYMIALGLLARLDPGPFGRSTSIVLAIILLVFYAVYCDPLWAMVAGIAWSVPFAVVMLHPLRLRSILVRALALACCLAALGMSGTGVYLYTLSQYTARVQFAETLDRVRSLIYVSAVSYSPNMKYFHVAVVGGLLIGLFSASGRLRTLVLAAFVSWLFYVACSINYLILLDIAWVGPIPIYLEQCLFPLFCAGTVAGSWSFLRWVWSRVRPRQETLGHASHPARLRLQSGVAGVLAIAAVLMIPARVIYFAATESQPFVEMFYLPWPNQPELDRFLTDRLALKISSPFRGSVNFLTVDQDTGVTMADLWSRGIPTANEYSQLVTPPLLFFLHTLLEKDVRGHLNRFEPFWSAGVYTLAYWKALQAFGVRFSAERWPLPNANNPELNLVALPYRPIAPDQKPGQWYLYELPRPNTGDYSPTTVITAESGAAIMAALALPKFDFTKQVVLTAPVEEPLIPAHSLRLSVIHNGMHLSGHSDGTSLVILPQQFSHCLRSRDRSVRLVRADLVLTGAIFQGDIDTDISFEYGMFSPWCRVADLKDLKSLDLRIDLRMPHLAGGQLLPDWPEAVARLKAAAEAVQ